MGRRGPQSSFAKAKFTGRRTQERQEVFEANSLKTSAAFQAYIGGFRLWWRCCPAYLKSIGVKPEGTYDVNNHTGGKIPCNAEEIHLTEQQACRILWYCYKSGQKGEGREAYPWLTEDMLKLVKKCLSHVYQIQGGEDLKKKNWAKVLRTWLRTNPKKMSPRIGPKTKADPKRTPTPRELKTAFSKPWSPTCEWPLFKWLTGLVAAWHWAVCGSRPNEDMDRIKFSPEHEVEVEEGWCRTALSNGEKKGRCKLRLRKRNTRPWSVYCVCLCKGGEHADIPKDIEYERWGYRGDPPAGYDPDNLPWHTNCPVAAVSLILKLQWEQHLSERGKKGFLYRKFGQSKRLQHRHVTETNHGDPVQLAKEWFVIQGIERASTYDRNSGRASLGRWLGKLGLPYGPGFQIHADLPKTWNDHYQLDNFKKDSSQNRQQSLDPEKCCAALRKLAAWFGLGKCKPKDMSRVELLLVEMLEGQDLLLEEGACPRRLKRRKRIVMGMQPSDSDDFEFAVQKKKKKRKRRKRRMKQESSDDDEFVVRKPRRRRKRKREVKSEESDNSSDMPIMPSRKFPPPPPLPDLPPEVKIEPKRKRKRREQVKKLLKEEPVDDHTVKFESDETADSEAEPPRPRKRQKRYLPPGKEELAWLDQ